MLNVLTDAVPQKADVCQIIIIICNDSYFRQNYTYEFITRYWFEIIAKNFTKF